MESSRIFIKGLPPNFSAEDLKSHFSMKFPVTDAKLIPHRKIGYVGYKAPQDASKAVKYYNKSFIRMSRIGVELARSVEEQSALRPSAVASSGIKRNDLDRRNGAIESYTQVQKKIKVTHPNNEQAKLQEFLEVMQPSSKSDIWANRPASPVHTSVDSRLIHANITKTGPETEEGHELAPMERMGLSESAEPEGQVSKSTNTEELVLDSASVLPRIHQENMGSAIDPIQGTSDADWLRSRTSRLLGLIDDEGNGDGTPNASAQLNDNEARDAAEFKSLKSAPNGERSKRGIEADHEYNEEEIRTMSPQPLDSEEKIVSNGRLFIRNLTYTATEDDLRRVFEESKYGAIEEVS